MNRPKFFRRNQDKYENNYVSRQKPQTAGQSRLKTFIVAVIPFLWSLVKGVFKHLAALFSKPGLATLKNNVVRLTSFMLLLSLYLFDTHVVRWIFKFNFLPKSISAKLQAGFAHFYIKSVSLLDKPTESISRIDLIELSLRNMQVKKTRTLVTIGGMAIGIGAIVFLVSIGYGLQQLVISRVARLDEMRQADVYPQTGGVMKITDKTLSDFKEIPSVDKALPLIAVVGRVNYQNSVSDMAVYGVTADYLKQSAIKPIQGKIFESNELSQALPAGEVAGAATSTQYELSNIIAMEEKIGNIQFTLSSGKWIRVREHPNTSAKIIGYTKRTEGVQSGEEVWGASYDEEIGKAGKDENGKWLGKWILSPVLLWKEQLCDKDKGDCEDRKYTVMRDEDGKQVQKEGYFAQVNVGKEKSVLGISTGSVLSASASGSLDFIEIASESAEIANTQAKKVSLPQTSIKQAIVNRAMLKVLGIKETEALGKTFDASFVVVGDLLADNKDRVESNPAPYTIIGVTPDDKTPVFYVPFVDVRSLGIVNYSQVKVVTKDQSDLTKVRRQIEAQGYLTRSVADTVSQINSLFATIRIVLAMLGTVALTVAALGMFNTLTVSLLERTREVGLMKAMGMKSSEIEELFLTESMIMGLFGGLFGILLGFVVGKLLGLLLSIFAIIKGVGFVDVAYIPLPFLLLVVGLSLIVGVMTGFYPARRATKISALNALRYE